MGILFFHYYPGEGKTWLQAVYMSIITLSTVGFGAFMATTEVGKVFGAFWMLFGVAALVSFVSAFTEMTLKAKEVERFDPAMLHHNVSKNLSKASLQSGKMTQSEFLRFALLQCKIA